MEENQAIDALTSKFIGKTARVTTKNQRKFQGKIVCIDSKGSLIMHDSVAEIPPSQNCPLNYDLVNCVDSKLNYTPPSELSDEKKNELIRQYMGTHYYFGSIMVSGPDIEKLQILVGDPNPKKEQ